MNRPLNTTQKTLLEGMLDQHSLTELLCALSDICDEKADHILSSYQDTALSNDWKNAGRVVSRVSRHLNVMVVSR